MIRALLIDDEPLARRGLRALLRPHTEILVVGECRNGREARAALLEERPDLIFLDVQMPDLDGFSVLAEPLEERPAVIFVTAFEGHARRAFDVGAVDYLLKPFDRHRFEVALGRARKQLEQRVAASSTDGRLWIRDGRRVMALDPAEITHAEARGNYLRLYRGSRSVLHREPIGRFAARMAPTGFRRVGRSTLINIAHLSVATPVGDGRYRLRLGTGIEVITSRRLTPALRQELDRLSG